MDRRHLLGTLAAAGLTSIAPVASRAATGATGTTGTKLTLLGVKGGPTPSLDVGQPANLLVVDGTPYLIDCGYGVLFQLLKVGITAEKLAAVFVTHHHFDHNADLGNVLMTAWQRGLDRRISVVAPTPARKMIANYLDFSAPDIEFRSREEGRRSPAPLIDITEVTTTDGLIYQDERVKVSALAVDHWTVRPALAYRFDAADRSVVFSGDTAYFPALAEFAKDADVLVHEALYLPAVEAKGDTRGAPTMRTHILKSHTSTGDVGRLAAAAGVGTLVLSHLVPYNRAISDTAWIEGVRRHYNGNVIVGRDLMTL